MDRNSVPLFMQEHSYISIDQYNDGFTKCKGDWYDNRDIPACREAIESYWKQFEGINRYNPYGDCSGYKPNKNIRGKDYIILNGEKIDLPKLFTLGFVPPREPNEFILPCCNTTNIYHYLNREDVQQAFGVRSKEIPTGKWEICSEEIGDYYDSTYTSMIPFHTFLLKYYKGLIYSGDTDLSVNALGSQMAVNVIEPDIKMMWNKWYTYPDSKGFVNVAGYTKEKDNLVYATIRGSGHMTPTYRPQESFKMMSNWVNDKPL